MRARIIAQGEKTGTLYMTIDMRDTIVVVDASLKQIFGTKGLAI
jgi:hypothetical protein